jgi:hypothetical protein
VPVIVASLAAKQAYARAHRHLPYPFHFHRRYGSRVRHGRCIFFHRGVTVFNFQDNVMDLDRRNQVNAITISF